MEDLQVDMEVHQVGGEVTRNGWQWNADSLLGWISDNPYAAGLVVLGLLLVILVWRAGARPSRY